MDSFRAIPKLAHEIAHQYCGGKWIAVGGGGYDIWRVIPRAWSLIWLEMINKSNIKDPLPESWLKEWEQQASTPLIENWDDPKNMYKPIPRKKDIEEKKLAILEAERQAELERQREVERLAEIERKSREEMEKAEANKNKKTAYLTFDDGPSKESTYAILDILAEYNIKATFFVVGKMVVNNPEVLLRTVEEGHAIGNHSYSHDYGYIYHSTKNFMRDIDMADRAIKDVVGDDFETKVMRFPGGSFGKQKIPMIKAVTENGYRYFDWNALNGDAEGALKTPDFLIKRIKETYRNQNNLIILMHDTDAKSTTVESLGKIIDFLIEQGYEFGIIDENYEK